MILDVLKSGYFGPPHFGKKLVKKLKLRFLSKSQNHQLSPNAGIAALLFQSPVSQERDIMTKEWDRGCQIMLEQVHIKLGVWKQLPYCLAGLASVSAPDVTMAASRALQLYDHHPEAAHHHSLSNLFCSPLSENFRKCMLALASGEAMESQPTEFQCWALRGRMWSLFETPVEGLHAKVKHLLSCASGFAAPPYVSLALRMPEIEQRMVQEPKSFFTALVDMFDQVRQPSRCIEVGVLTRHQCLPPSHFPET